MNTTEPTTGYWVRRMSGRCFNGAHRDAGHLYHAVPSAGLPCWAKALCGKTPGIRGNGWTDGPAGVAVTCPACLKRLANIGGQS